MIQALDPALFVHLCVCANTDIQTYINKARWSANKNKAVLMQMEFIISKANLRWLHIMQPEVSSLKPGLMVVVLGIW